MEKSTYRRLTDALILVLSFLLVVIIYSASVPKDFTNWDDPQYIVNNPLIRGFTPDNVQRILSQPYFGNYAPVSLLSYTLDFSLWGLNPGAFHVHNVLLHLGSVAALYYLLWQLGLGAFPRYVVVLLFAVHPTNVESVSWASERKNLLCALFFLLSFGQYVRYTAKRNRSSYLLAVLFFILSILSKALTVVTPLLFVAFDYMVRRERLREIRWVEKAPFFLLALGHVWLSIHAAHQGGSLHSYYETSPWLAILDTGRLVGQYLALLVWPSGLTPLITPKLIPSVFDLRVILPFLLMLSVLVVWFCCRRQSFFWVTFFLLLLAPVMNIVPLPVVMAVRYVYLPQIGLWILLACLVERVWTRLGQKERLRWAIPFAVLVWVTLLTVQARSWAGEWKNSVTLWSGAVRRDPINLIARANLGQAYLEKGQRPEAVREFSRVLAYHPENVLALTGLAMCSLAAGDTDSARSYADRATRLSPDYALGFRLLGRSHLMQKDLSNARFALLRAYELNPSDNGTLDDLVSVYQLSDRPLEGLFLADLMLRNSPRSFEAHWARARLLMTAERYPDAIQSLETALRLSPGPDSAAIGTIRQALAEAKARERAVSH